MKRKIASLINCLKYENWGITKIIEFQDIKIKEQMMTSRIEFTDVFPALYEGGKNGEITSIICCLKYENGERQKLST